MSEINSGKLESYASDVLVACRATLAWLENNGQETSLAAADMRYAIELLEEAGVDLSDTVQEPQLSEEDLSKEVYRPDEEEMADLLEAIAESEAEDAQGIYYTTEQVMAELTKYREQLAQEQKPRKKRASA